MPIHQCHTFATSMIGEANPRARPAHSSRFAVAGDGSADPAVAVEVGAEAEFDLREQVVEVRTNLDALRRWIRYRREQSLGAQQYFGSIDKLPSPIEAVFNTPSHHRVHHGANPQWITRHRCL